ncbi:hypothetical protein COJ46_02050 [Bacillus sp. AFS077874]|uniref:teichoic acid D-Ala incorporation-associated protein DltX n=2 Tax=Gottfriedia TaxID=2837503 RepID=UPI000BEE07C4|nr:hypothetical protein CON00_13620 [Bacillus sp. AFS096315]PFM82617.1 hypothetical protein COJ46_02050 [Bacillus sp. AFS077874]
MLYISRTFKQSKPSILNLNLSWLKVEIIMKEKKTNRVFKNAMIFQWFFKTSYYLMIIILLIYFYICNSSGSSTFIYNEF